MSIQFALYSTTLLCFVQSKFQGLKLWGFNYSFWGIIVTAALSFSCFNFTSALKPRKTQVLHSLCGFRASTSLLCRMTLNFYLSFVFCLQNKLSRCFDFLNRIANSSQLFWVKTSAEISEVCPTLGCFRYFCELYIKCPSWINEHIFLLRSRGPVLAESC